MKKYLILIFLINFNAFYAQKNNQILSKERLDTDYNLKVKDVTIQVGKPIFVVVFITNMIPNDSLLVEREIKELKKNFKNTSIYRFNNKGKLDFKNNENKKYSFDDVNENYSKVIYWDGKKDSEVFENEKFIKNTEFFSEILNLNKKSSYVVNYENKIDSIKQQLMWNPDEYSKKLSDKYLKNCLFRQISIIENYEEFLNFDLKGVKKLTINSNLKGTKNPWQEVYFNQEGYPTKSIVSTDDSVPSKVTINVQYKDNLVSKVTFKLNNRKEDEFNQVNNICYSNGKLIVAENIKLTFYSLSSKFLTFESFYADNENYDFWIDKYKLENTNELNYYQSGGLNNFTLKFNDIENFLPLKKTLRPKSDNIITTLTKVDNLNFVVKYDKTERLKIKYLNENLIKEVLFKDSDESKNNKKVNQYKFDFIYEYYK